MRPSWLRSASTPLRILQAQSRRLTMSSNSSHPDFKQTEASRPDWTSSSSVRFTKTPSPDWKFGDGSNRLEDEASSEKKHIPIDPYADGRPAAFNYKLLASAIVPRPIALLSTRSASGSSENLAPFSYFNMINFDPPLFVVGFTGSLAAPKDSLRNLLDSRECVVNIISEHWVEAANSTAIPAPYGTSEWEVSGLTPDHSCETVRAPRVKEAVFSIEAKLDSVREWDSKSTPGKKSGVMVILEGTRFWVREDALNEEKNMVNLDVLKPMARLGGITYQRTTEAIELARPQFDKPTDSKN